MIKKLWSQTILRYCLIGGLSYAIELSFLIGLHSGLHLQRTIATGIAFWVGLILSFILQKLLAFRDYKKEKSAVTKQGTVYVVLVAWNYLVTLLIVSSMPSSHLIYSRTLALLLTTAWNFFVYKHLIFSDKPLFDAEKIQNWFKRNKRVFMYILVLTIPVLVFFYKYLATSNRLFVGDFDYYAQMYEAFRISVLHFHQFPLWNPWMSGGLPLYANPQFGLVSIQSLLVLIFGTVYGLKLAYVIYAVAGFWGIYILSRKVAKASPLRAALISYIWIFCGFFASHGIYHFTFTSFFLLPWVVYFVAIHKHKRAWLGLAVTMSIIILSSVHYAFLFLTLLTGLFVILTFFDVFNKTGRLQISISHFDLRFIAKTAALTILLTGYRFVTTLVFVSSNQRPSAVFHESPNSPVLLLKATFLPLGNRFFKLPSGLQWPWGEYSMYVGLGVTLACLVCLVSYAAKLYKRRKIELRKNRIFYVVALVGLGGFVLAMGEFSKTSPYNILHLVPGFSQMRVASRWMILAVFAVLFSLSTAKSRPKLINLLLAIAVVELFITYGPPRNTGYETLRLPRTTFSNTFEQFDNGGNKQITATNLSNSYLVSTDENKGQIYSDDSIIDTRDHVLLTNRCGANLSQDCGFIMSKNARVVYWSPNFIIIRRTSVGIISLNMNPEEGWQINNQYVFGGHGKIDPALQFTIKDGATQDYTIRYAPRLSPAWFSWEAQKRLPL